jgi:hypothetical protein
MFQWLTLVCAVFSCAKEKSAEQIQVELAGIDVLRGEVTLCGADQASLGSVSFALSCSDSVRNDFNLATALLHSFEYAEAEKVFVRVADKDPGCVMAYWGIAMSNFHPLWSAPDSSELQKGVKVIRLARSIISDTSSRESRYIEAIATIYDNWDNQDHKARLLKFEKACEALYARYPDDDEAAIFYSLALGASADPKDKTFGNQRKAGVILNSVLQKNPNHPGISHYIIHNFDYPEIAKEGLSAARKYASIAAASAHAQHMPSHIFTRLGLWDESIQSNINSIAAAQCYAEQSGMTGSHWDEELHGLDYLIYAYLQKSDDVEAKKRIDYLQNIKQVSPVNFKGAYSLAAGAARYAVERKDWEAAARIEFTPKEFPWGDFPWESANINLARFLGAIQTNKPAQAKAELVSLQDRHDELVRRKDTYKANLVQIQLKSAWAWQRLKEGKKDEAVALQKEAAEMEEATAKHPVTPGEIIPARELLGDMYVALGKFSDALQAYEADLMKHPNKFNDLYGAAFAASKIGDTGKARVYYEKMLSLAGPSTSDRVQLALARTYVAGLQ